MTFKTILHQGHSLKGHCQFHCQSECICKMNVFYCNYVSIFVVSMMSFLSVHYELYLQLVTTSKNVLSKHIKCVLTTNTVIDHDTQLMSVVLQVSNCVPRTQQCLSQVFYEFQQSMLALQLIYCISFSFCHGEFSGVYMEAFRTKLCIFLQSKTV